MGFSAGLGFWPHLVQLNGFSSVPLGHYSRDHLSHFEQLNGLDVQGFAEGFTAGLNFLSPLGQLSGHNPKQLSH